MAHFWNRDAAGDWVATPVDATLVRRVAGPQETWALLCPPSSDARVNGERVPLGLAILADRDELRITGHPVRFFSTETLAHVEVFPEGAGGFCPRCKQEITSGSVVVRCPGCGLCHHASDELPCWTYAGTCAGCTQDTAMDAGFTWTPENL